MKWSDLLRNEIEYRYMVTGKLMDLVSDGELGWKPATGTNWMTTGQLLAHLSTCCAMTFRGFATGEWGPPPSEESGGMMPPAEKMPTVKSVAEAKAALAEDKRAALAVLADIREADLEEKPTPAPWDPTPMPLGGRLLSMVDHLNQHKGQLYYYLKLQGKPVDTGHLWGM